MSNHRKDRPAGKGRDKKPDLFPGVQSLFDQALQRHRAGQLAEAEALYRQVLTFEPRHADSLQFLGVIAHQVGRLDIAVDLIGQAIRIDKNIPSFHNNLGTTLQDQGKLDDAISCYQRALALRPDYPEAHINLGNALKELKKYSEAVKHYKRAITLKSDSAEACNNLGATLRAQGNFAEAIKYLERAITLRPTYAEAYSNLGNVLRDQDRLDESLACHEKALALSPNSTEAHNNLGSILKDKGRIAEAAAHYKQAFTLNPEYSDAYYNLANILQGEEKFDEAISLHEQASSLKPNSIEILNNLGSVYAAKGQPEEAIKLYQKVVALQPDYAHAHGNLLLTMIYAASVSPETLAATAREFGTKLANPLRRQRPLARDKNPARKLRIGYVSPDFHEHAVNYFFEPLLRHHDRTQFEVFAYSNNKQDDAITQRLKKEFDHWRDIKALTDDVAADVIETDAIDILVDLAGHTGDNRLLVFARKPAPLQVTWLGYPASTGMAAMDYRITDAFAEPPGMTEHLNTETLWRLPGMFCCYAPHENSPAVIDHPPCEDNGFVTFGCFNNFSRVTDLILAAWAKILAQVPDSRLLLEIRGLDAAKFRAEVEERLQRLGLPLDRVILESRKKSNQFTLYNKIDIALDPFPCVGGTTSMDTLWMGVPLVTLAGPHFLSRIGVTILINAGLPELVAQTVDEYVGLATGLATDWPRLRGLRHNLRDRVAKSPLMDQTAFARNMETAYRAMWRKWCDGLTSHH